MARPQTARKPSTTWDRLRPAKQDPLESMGFVSKGDTKLLDFKAQEVYYQKITLRYMDFCKRHSSDLDAAFASLSALEDRSTSSNPMSGSQMRTTGVTTPLQPSAQGPPPERELSLILTALRKLREGVLGSSKQARSPIFSQRVHVFNIRVAILALDPPSYHPSLSYLLSVLHTSEYPLPESELVEMTTYAILDKALRQNDLIAAYALRHDSKRKFGYQSRTVDTILRAVVTNNWISFWRVRRQVDGYVRSLIHWHIASIRGTTLRAFGRAYLTTNLSWLIKCATGSEMSWEELVEKENVGWSRDNERITIRKPKTKQ